MDESKERFKPVESLKKLVVMGLGAGLMAKDEVEKFGREFSRKFEMGEKDAKQFMDDLTRRYEKTWNKLETRVEDLVRDFLKKADVVSGTEFKALQKEIRELQKTVSKGADAKDE